MPTTTHFINAALPILEPVNPKRSHSPVIMELASASLDLVFSTDFWIKEAAANAYPAKPVKRQSDIIVSKTREFVEMEANFERSTSEPRSTTIKDDEEEEPEMGTKATADIK